MDHEEGISFQKETLLELAQTYGYTDVVGFANDLMGVLMEFFSLMMIMGGEEIFVTVLNYMQENYSGSGETVREVFSIITQYKKKVYELENHFPKRE